MMLTPHFVLGCVFCITLVALSISDFWKGILPDPLLIALGALGVWRFGGNYILSSFLLGALGYGLYKIYPFLRTKEGLGFGDVKMMAVCGLWLPLSDIPLFLIVAGGVGVGIALAWRFIYKTRTFPLGPALALALGVCVGGFTDGDSTMTPSLVTHTLPPQAGGKPDSIVVFLHGYGSNGEDLLSLGHVWGALLPHTVFVAPDGIKPHPEVPGGHQWFGLQDWDVHRLVKDMHAITPELNRYLDGLLKQYDLAPDRLALVGFSQGAMLSMHIALHRPKCAGVVAYSGALLEDPKVLKVAAPPVLLIHGTADEVLEAHLSQLAHESLTRQGVPSTLLLLPNLAHSIDERGLERGGEFLREKLEGK